VTIRRGEPWGERLGPLPDHGVVVRSDAGARSVVEEACREQRDPPPIGLAGGDLWRTLGSPRDRLHTGDAVTFPVDLGEVLADGRLYRFVAHLVARRGWWRGPAWMAMNAAWLGTWNLGPRAHPGDGLLDVLDVRLRPAERLAARSRARTGTHVPHPRIAERRAAAVQVSFERPLPIWLDGERVTEARHLSVRVRPDALTIVV
jgi:hypothetical protein